LLTTTIFPEIQDKQSSWDSVTKLPNYKCALSSEAICGAREAVQCPFVFLCCLQLCFIQCPCSVKGEETSRKLCQQSRIWHKDL